MRRAGFTMVELIFVIVVIGILSSIALPKFGEVKDKAKVNSELSFMHSFDGVITARREFQMDDFANAEVDWHNLGADASSDEDEMGAALLEANKAKTILGGIGKKMGNLKAIAYGIVDSNGVYEDDEGTLHYSLIILKSTASDSVTGVKASKKIESGDFKGKPDKNDFWVFNPSSVDFMIEGSAGTQTASILNPTIIEAGTIGLVDVNGSSSVNFGYYDSEGSGNGDIEFRYPSVEHYKIFNSLISPEEESDDEEE